MAACVFIDTELPELPEREARCWASALLQTARGVAEGRAKRPFVLWSSGTTGILSLSNSEKHWWNTSWGHGTRGHVKGASKLGEMAATVTIAKTRQVWSSEKGKHGWERQGVRAGGDLHKMPQPQPRCPPGILQVRKLRPRVPQGWGSLLYQSTPAWEALTTNMHFSPF